MLKLKIAFIGWNPFQLIHVSALIKNIPNSVFILENKHNSLAQFDTALLAQDQVPVIVYQSTDIHKLDNLYDVIICQTVFTDIHKFNNAKIAMIQYGYAKEAHNYGPWRSFADVCFTYGPYASEKISYFCSAKEVGFLRQEEVDNTGFINQAQQRYGQFIDSNKKTILYLPTWGEHSSQKSYIKGISSLSDKYNVLMKLHHNSDLLGLRKGTKKIGNTPIFGANDDSLQLIILSDIVISDYSGAIFDAIYCKKPIVLLNNNFSVGESNKVDEYSLEYKNRDQLGYIVNNSSDLVHQIEKGLLEKTSVSKELYDQLFYKAKNPARIVLGELSNPTSIIPQRQHYLRDAMRQLYAMKYSSVGYRTKNRLQSTFSMLLITMRKLYER